MHLYNTHGEVGRNPVAFPSSASLPAPPGLAALPALSLHVYVTPHCNLHCAHCYNPYPSGTTAAGILTPELIAAFLTRLAAHFSLDLELEGGEFFLRPDATAILAALPEPVLRRATVTTNGTVSIPDAALAYLGRLAALRLSAEGHTDALHRALRRASLMPLLASLDRLLDVGVMPVVRTTLSRLNADKLPEMIRAWGERGVSRLSFFELQASGRARDLRALLLGQADLEAVLDALAGLRLPAGLSEWRLSLPHHRLAVVRRQAARLAREGCLVQEAAASPSLTLDYQGDIGICPWSVGRDRETGAQLGRLDPRDLDRASEAVIALWRSGRLLHQCDYCTAVRIVHER